MTEKEKRDRGMLYAADADEQLSLERLACKDMCHKLNGLPPSNAEEKNGIIRGLLARTGKSFCILSPFYADYGYNIEIGENFFANHNCVILDGAKVTFGDNVYIAPDCGFYTAGHPIDSERRNAGLEYAYPITVGNNVWFGGGVRVCPGVTIGNNVVIGAGSVVTKDIPDNVVAAGNPCRVIRPITDADKNRDYTFKR